MKQSVEGWYTLEIQDIIRANQLVRSYIDLDGFTVWYQQLSTPEQPALIYTLFEYAHQAGADELIYRDALTMVSLDEQHPLVLQQYAFLRGSRRDWVGLHQWIGQLPSAERGVLFTLAVALFGHAERRVLAREAKERCNHWWHRDLLDPQVVAAILNDPH
jgi:hypothetical protein